MARHKTEAATYEKIMLRLPLDLLTFYKAEAEKEHRSLNAQIVYELETRMRKVARQDSERSVHAGTP